MIDKLKKKVFWIIQILLTVIIMIITLLQLLQNYNIAIMYVSRTMDKYSLDKDIGPKDKKEQELEYESFNSDVYKFFIKDNTVIINENNADDKLEDISIKASNAKNDVGVIKQYMYKARKLQDNSYSVTLVKNEDIALYIRKLFIRFSLISSFFVIVAYFVSKRISTIIVKPIKQSFERQKQFISDSSHELKTPIAIIKVNAQMEEKKLGENKWNKYIQNETENMNKLVNDLLLLSKVENYENIQKYDKFDLSKEVEIIIATFEALAYEKQIVLETEIDKNINMVGSKEDIKHIISTLLDNAIKHTKSEEQVTVKLDKRKNEIILQVKNVGDPIPKEEREKIFERFYRIDKARNRNEKRYGLGLSIAKSTVEKYNGSIEVKCENGITNFIVKIPIN